MVKPKRKVPLRKCVVTNDMRPKQEMIRVVRNKEKEVFVDPTGKLNGRGAYLTIDRQVFERAKNEHILEKTFQVDIPEELFTELFALVDKK
ncbi:MAG TPA: YlxR family protein [Pseudogracilibacillus sp.]|nr:YlxR family protein [Pseudogracilibacillus sp.]